MILDSFIIVCLIEDLCEGIFGEFMSFLNWDVPISPQILEVLSHYYFLKFYLLFLAIPGSSLLPGLFRSCGERGLLSVAVHGLLIVVASLVVMYRLSWLLHMGSVLVVPRL